MFPSILASLPSRWRYRVATAMSKEFFDAHFFPERSFPARISDQQPELPLVHLFFNAFPLPQRQAGAGETIRYMGELVEQGWSILIFPEGDRTLPGRSAVSTRRGDDRVPSALAGSAGAHRGTRKSSEPGCEMATVSDACR